MSEAHLTGNATAVDYACDAGIVTLTINRPQRLNSLDLATVDTLIAAMQHAVKESAKALILTGAGRAFCTGADLSSALAQRDAQGAIDIAGPLREHYNRLVTTLRHLPFPVVIAINGLAVGGGAALALSGDVAIGARSAALQFSFGAIGLIPDMGATWMLPRLAGRARALGMALLGERIDAETAKHWGLIWDVCADDRLASCASELAQRLALLPAAALQATRVAVQAGATNTLDAQLDLEADIQGDLGRQPAFAQAVTTFLARGKDNSK